MTVTVTEKVVKIVTVDWAALAAAVKAEILTKLTNDMDLWKNDVSMLSVVLRDAADGLNVCSLLNEKEWKRVEGRLWEMDTAPREYVYDWIEKHSCENLFRLLLEQGA